MIPSVFHRIWLGEAPIPAVFDEYWARFHELHPNCRFETWTDETVKVSRCLAEYENPWLSLSSRADIARLNILYDHGGVYVDCDVEPLAAWGTLVESAGDRAFAGWEDTENLCNAVLGAPKGHAALLAPLALIPGIVAESGAWTTASQTGPRALTAAWTGRSDVVEFPASVFYPVHWNEDARLRLQPETLSIHHWAFSWQNS